MQLGGKRAFISGSTQGIGFAIAEALLSEGATVVINGRSQTTVDNALNRLRDSVPSADVSGIAADFSDSREVERLLTLVGEVDIVVWGRIIFISSESGVNIPADMVHYGATKAAMIALSNGLPKLTRGTDVTVNTILGGPTYSDGVANTVNTIAAAQGIESENMKAVIIAGNHTSLLERFIEPHEIAHLVSYLASPLSSATNGAALRADGGVLTASL